MNSQEYVPVRRHTQQYDTGAKTTTHMYSPRFSSRCSFGNQKINFERPAVLHEPLTPKLPASGDELSFRKTFHHVKSISELKASSETNHTSTESCSRQPIHPPTTKKGVRMDQINNLLSEFKNKFAHIQQKYSLPVKPKDPQHLLKLCPLTPQCNSIHSRFDHVPNKIGIEDTRTLAQKAPAQAFSHNERTDFSGQHPISASSEQNAFTPKKQNFEENTKQSQTVPSSVASKTVDRTRFRATFGPTQCRPMNIPVRKIKQAEQAMPRRLKFQHCKDVESEVEQQAEQDEMLESVVIEKFSCEYKIRRTETLSPGMETPHLQMMNSPTNDLKKLQGLKRFRSARSPY